MRTRNLYGNKKGSEKKVKQILVIEDDRDLSRGLCMALQEQEVRVIPAFDLKSAKEILKTDGIDLLLLDINLPDGNGLEFLEQIRKKSEIPVIL